MENNKRRSTHTDKPHRLLNVSIRLNGCARGKLHVLFRGLFRGLQFRNFRAILGAACRTPVNLTAASGAVGNVIPKSLLNPVALKVAALLLPLRTSAYHGSCSKVDFLTTGSTCSELNHALKTRT